MVFEVLISTFDASDAIVSYSVAEFSELPSPEEVKLVTQLVMSDAKCAVATVHVSGNPSLLYGIIVEGYDNGKEE
jgi:hypothetical protein